MPEPARVERPAPQSGKTTVATPHVETSSATPLPDLRPAGLAEQQLKATIAASPQVQAATQFQARVSQHVAAARPPAPLQRKSTATGGLPEQLKSGVEQLSGIALDHVRVHYNSPRPAQLQAHAYAQGSDIHLAPGQEKHLPHETWHVVQQAQGRVRPTLQMKQGIPVNDDSGLEREADRMGARAMQLRLPAQESGPLRQPNGDKIVQRIAVQISLEEKPEEKKEQEPQPEASPENKDMVVEGEQKVSPPSEKVEDMDLQEEKEDKKEPETISPPSEKQDLEDVDMEGEAKGVSGIQVQAPENQFDKAIISRIAIVGRPAKLFSGSMGDHTTAFAVHQKGLMLALMGKTLPEALQHVLGLVAEAKKLPGMKEKTLKKSGREDRILEEETKITSLHTKAQEALQTGSVLFTQFFQRMVAAYLEFRELIPLSAMNISEISFGLAGKGKAESQYVNLLVGVESGIVKPDQNKVQGAIINLLDLGGLAIAMAEPDRYKATNVLPGTEEKTDPFKSAKAVIKQHLMSIKISFPKAYAIANFTDIPKAVKHILSKGTLKIQGRANANTEFSINTIKAKKHLISTAFANMTQELLEVKNNGAQPPAVPKRKTKSKSSPPKPSKSYQQKLVAQEALLNLEDPAQLDQPGREKMLTLINFYYQQSIAIFPTNKMSKELLAAFIEINRNSQEMEVQEKALLYSEDIITKAQKLSKKHEKLPLLPLRGSTVPEVVEDPQPKKEISPELLLPEEDQPKEPVNEEKKEPQVDENAMDTQLELKKENKKEEKKKLDEEEKRQPIATEIELNEDGTIKNFVSGGRTLSPFGTSMGAHSTAWVVHVDEIRTQLIGKSIAEAYATMGNLSTKAKERKEKMITLFKVDDLGGSGTVTNNHIALLNQAQSTLDKFPHTPPDKVLTQLPTLQSFINALLGFINLIPGSTFNSVNTDGHGESGNRYILTAVNQGSISDKLLKKAGKTINEDILLSWDVENIIIAIRNALYISQAKLLDLKQVGGGEITTNLQTYHKESITHAYPVAVQVMLGKDGAIEPLRKKIVKMQREAERNVDTTPPNKIRKTKKKQGVKGTTIDFTF